MHFRVECGDPEIARRFKKVFNEISDDIFDLYIELIATNKLVDWVKNLLPKLPQNKLEEVGKAIWDSLNVIQQQRLDNYLGIPIPLSRRDFLIKAGYSTQEIDQMSPTEAYFLEVGEVMKQNYQSQPRYGY